MARTSLIGLLTIASLTLLITNVFGGGTAAVAFAVTAVAFPALLMLAAAGVRGGRLRAPAWVAVALLLILEASVAGLLLLRGTVSTDGWILGLPIPTALQIFGMCLVPLALVALGFALTFFDFRVSESDLGRLRQVRTERKP